MITHAHRAYVQAMELNERDVSVKLVCMDLEGTLCHGRHLWSAVVGNRFRSARRAPRVAGHVLYIIWAALAQRRLGLASASSITRKGISGLASLLDGMDEESARTLFERTGHIMAATARPALLATLRQHRDAGYRVVLISAVFEPVVQEVAYALGVADALGTRLEVSDGRYTGRLATQPLQGPSKLATLQEHLAGKRIMADWPGSYAYADSITDVPLLEAVGHPVVVNPDPQLADLARSRGWPALDTRRSNSGRQGTEPDTRA